MLKLYSWNVNGIRSVMRKGTFLPFIAKAQPDILCMQETRAEQGQAVIDLPQYHEYWNSGSRKGYSSTAIFTKPKPLKITYDFPDDLVKKYTLVDSKERDSTDEGRIITAEYDQFFLVTVYTPNAKDDLSRLPLRHEHWDPAFLEYCQQLEKKKPVVFCGDLNVAHTEDDLARPKPNMGKKGFTLEERAGFQKFIDAGFIDTLRLFKKGSGYYTWWTNWARARERNVGWRIDYFLVSSSLKNKVKDAAIHPEFLGSDHCPVSLTLDV